MAALKGKYVCFIHDPTSSGARSVARAKGGAAKAMATKRPPSRPTPAASASAAFNIGTIEHRNDIPNAILRVTRAIARGELDVKRGRLLIESLRMAAAAFETFSEVPDDKDGRPPGAREATDLELRYILEHDGLLPPGLESVHTQFWVRGAEWQPPALAEPET